MPNPEIIPLRWTSGRHKTSASSLLSEGIWCMIRRGAASQCGCASNTAFQPFRACPAAQGTRAPGRGNEYLPASDNPSEQCPIFTAAIRRAGKGICIAALTDRPRPCTLTFPALIDPARAICWSPRRTAVPAAIRQRSRSQRSQSLYAQGKPQVYAAINPQHGRLAAQKRTVCFRHDCLYPSKCFDRTRLI